MRDRSSAGAPSADAAYVRCGNCTRERVPDDLFWHEDDQHWYCQDVRACNHRLVYQLERGYDEDVARIENRRDASGVIWL